jgi:hypothetical protein
MGVWDADRVKNHVDVALSDTISQLNLSLDTVAYLLTSDQIKDLGMDSFQIT